MPSYDRSVLWQRSLAKSDDHYSSERERLRVAYEDLRARAKPIAEAIAGDFPWLTVHDVTHSEALWECADLIAGPSYPLNPAEAFVLGGAFLLHDLGMGLVAYQSHRAALQSHPLYRDTLARLLRQVTDRQTDSSPT